MNVNRRITILFILLSFPATLSESGESARKYWIFFKDRGASSAQVWIAAEANMSPRAKQRRAKHLGTFQVVEKEDLPLYQPYLEEILRLGTSLHQPSRWLNAASFSLTTIQKIQAENLPFVERVRPVLTFSRSYEVSPADQASIAGLNDTLDYGLSLAQVAMISATKVHELGITGDSVIVGMLDTGFRWRVHEALQNSRVIAERDFIQNDDTTANQAGDAPNQDEHGTLTMSVLGGFRSGQLIGPAYGVQFLLAKTEYVPTETRIEEDNWVAGIEWMENLGADIVSSSLGYNIFDDGTGYRWDNGDFDGRTAVTTRAAIRAARLGVIVCTAMGNEGNGDGSRGRMLAPADTDSILSVGAVTFSRTLTPFSSTGPTNDGRTKPEVVAPGAGVYCALPGESTYAFVSGTSLATPLTAASAALVLSSRPELTAMQVRDALIYTADSINSSRFSIRPNNFIGWGLVNPFKALSYPTLNPVGSATGVAVFIGAVNGIFSDSVILTYNVGSSPQQLVAMTRVAGPNNRSNGTFEAQITNTPGTLVRFSIEAVDSSGNRLKFPADSGQTFSFIFGSRRLIPPGSTIPSAFVLQQNYPNPFNGTTVIKVDALFPQEGSLTIYNLLGQEIKTLFSGTFPPGNNAFVWDGTSETGNPVASGLYLYTARAQQFAETKKMLLVR